MKKTIKNILREGLIKESVKIVNISDDDEYWDRVRLICYNDEGVEVGFADLDMWINESEWSYMSDDQEGKFTDDEFAEHFPEGGAAKLEEIKIKPEFRRNPSHSYGHELMTAVVNYCKSRDVKTMYLVASPTGNGPKIPLEKLGEFYQKHGFKVVKDFDNAYDMVAQLRENTNLLDEDLEMHDEIEKLADKLYKKIIEAITMRAFNVGNKNFRMPIILNSFKDLSSEFNALNQFVKDFNLSTLIVNKDEVGFRGRFSQSFLNNGQLEIAMDIDRIRKCVEEKVLPHFQEEFTEELKKEVTSDVYFCLYSSQISSTIIHEVQHVYDSWRSNKKYTNSKRAHKYTQKYGDSEIETPEQALAYIKQQHEINARFSQAIQKTNFNTFNYDKEVPNMPMNYLLMLDIKKVLEDFKRNFFGFKDMPPKSKERLINRFIKIYHEKEIQTNKNNKELLNKKEAQ